MKAYVLAALSLFASLYWMPTAQGKGRVTHLLRLFRAAKINPYAREVLLSPRAHSLRDLTFYLREWPQRASSDPWISRYHAQQSKPLKAPLRAGERLKFRWDDAPQYMNDYELAELFAVLAYADELGSALRNHEVLLAEQSFTRLDGTWLPYLRRRARLRSTWKKADFEEFGNRAGAHLLRPHARDNVGIAFQDFSVPAMQDFVLAGRAKEMGLEHVTIPKRWTLTHQQRVRLEGEMDLVASVFPSQNPARLLEDAISFRRTLKAINGRGDRGRLTLYYFEDGTPLLGVDLQGLTPPDTLKFLGRAADRATSLLGPKHPLQAEMEIIPPGGLPVADHQVVIHGHKNSFTWAVFMEVLEREIRLLPAGF